MQLAVFHEAFESRGQDAVVVEPELEPVSLQGAVGILAANRTIMSLVDITRTLYMLNGNMQANSFLQNLENYMSQHGNILQDYNAASIV